MNGGCHAFMVLLQIKGTFEFWTELKDLGNLLEGGWCIGGDFNEVLFTSDRSGRRRPNPHMETFKEWVSDFNLIDLTLQQGDHTWSNFRENPSFSKIDRLFVSFQRLDRFPQVALKGLHGQFLIIVLFCWTQS